MRAVRAGRALALALATLAGTLLVVPVSSGALSVANANENARTLVLSLPGPFNGCSFLSPNATPTTDALWDLLRPSAFVTLANGNLSGEGGPLATAELTSLTPQTVRYTIDPNSQWSNGAVFSGADLVAWWQKAKKLSSVLSDGYRAIQSLVLSDGGLTVTAIFSHPYADWNLLFRDVAAPGTSTSCAVRNLVTQPSLGPYIATSATAHRVVLVMNPEWPLDPNRFGRIVVVDSTALPKSSTEVFAQYSLAVSKAQLVLISANPSLTSRIGSSSNISELTFAPRGRLTREIAVREALSWSLARQTIIDQLFGAVTYSPQVAASALYSQGQQQYPGANGTGLPGQSTSTTSAATSSHGLSDCVTCALDVLREHGFRRLSSGWESASGDRLVVRLAVGPSALDKSIAKDVVAQWAAVGIATTVINEDSELRAAEAAATANADVALLARPTTTTPSYAARSWSGPDYFDTFPSGVRLAQVNTLFRQASAIFNPVTASSTWLQLDQVIQNDYWVRPLFTAPSLAVWTSTLATVQNSYTVAGFVDQIPLWSLVPSSN